MVSLTPNFSLPYPSASDEPCDFAEQWCDFTEAVDDVFDTFQEAVDRTVPTIPMAAIRLTVPYQAVNLAPVRFDTVLIDTAGMTDLDVDPFRITITRRGRYTVTGFINKLTAGVPLNSQISLLVYSQSGFNILAGTIDRGGGFPYRINSYVPVALLEVGEQIELSFNTGTSGTSQVDSASLSVAWHSDTEVP